MNKPSLEHYSIFHIATRKDDKSPFVIEGDTGKPLAQVLEEYKWRAPLFGTLNVIVVADIHVKLTTEAVVIDWTQEALKAVPGEETP